MMPLAYLLVKQVWNMLKGSKLIKNQRKNLCNNFMLCLQCNTQNIGLKFHKRNPKINRKMQEKLNFMSTLLFEMAPYLILIFVSKSMFSVNFVL